jgi:hypothetical protein
MKKQILWVVLQTNRNPWATEGLKDQPWAECGMQRSSCPHCHWMKNRFCELYCKQPTPMGNRRFERSALSWMWYAEELLPPLPLHEKQILWVVLRTNLSPKSMDNRRFERSALSWM